MGLQTFAEKNSDGSWSDYIFANGQRIARADSYDERIHTHGTSSGTGEYASWHLPSNGYVVKSGDKISWRQYQAGGGRGGVLLGFTDNSTANWDTYDQNGQVINSASTQDAWMERTVDLSAFAGKTINTLGVVTDAQTGACTWDVYYADMALVSTDGTVTPIYDRTAAISLSFYSSAGITNATAAAERSNTTDDAANPANTTTYYVGDQIGSTRMLLAAGGWPLSSDTYYPYGSEASPSADANHYKFTGKERDAESGLDYFGARYYSSNMGRWMSPDYSYDYDPEPVPHADLENPQTLNLYSYVQNNPLSNVDPDGHSNEGCTTSSSSDPDGTLHVVVNCPQISPLGQNLYRLAGVAAFGWELGPADWAITGGLFASACVQTHCGSAIANLFSGQNSNSAPPVVAPANTANPNPDDKNKKDKQKADDLIRGRLKKSRSYHSDYGQETYGDIKDKARAGDPKAQQMKKLIEQSKRLMDKVGN